MTRWELSRTWIVDLPSTAAHRVVRSCLAETGFTVTGADEQTVVAYAGSQLTARAVGVLWVQRDALPRRAVIAITDTADLGSTVTVTIDERLGQAALGRLARARYDRLFRAWINGLGSDLESTDASPGPVPEYGGNVVRMVRPTLVSPSRRSAAGCGEERDGRPRDRQQDPRS